MMGSPVQIESLEDVGPTVRALLCTLANVSQHVDRNSVSSVNLDGRY